MLNSTELEISTAHKNWNTDIWRSFLLSLSDVVFIMLISVKMPETENKRPHHRKNTFKVKQPALSSSAKLLQNKNEHWELHHNTRIQHNFYFLMLLSMWEGLQKPLTLRATSKTNTQHHNYYLRKDCNRGYWGNVLGFEYILLASFTP